MNTKLGLLPFLVALVLAAVCFSQWRQNAQLRREVIRLQQNLTESEERYEADQNELKQLRQLRGGSDDRTKRLPDQFAVPVSAPSANDRSAANSSLSLDRNSDRPVPGDSLLAR